MQIYQLKSQHSIRCILYGRVENKEEKIVLFIDLFADCTFNAESFYPS